MGTQSNQNELSRQQKYFLCNECCFWIFQLIVLGLGLAVMGKVIVSYNITKEVLSSTQYLHSQETVWLWNQGYVIDIKAEKTNNCPEGYEPLLTYQWPGTVDGCFCTSNTNGFNFDFVMEGKCSSELISYGCSTVNSMTQQTMNMWKGESLLCYKRANSMNFYNSIMITAPAGGSSASMTACGVNQTYEVNTLPGVECPITAISSSSVGTAQTTMTLDSTNGAKLNFINKTNYPIAAFKLTEYQFCDFFNVSNISPNKKGTYILEKSNLTNPCPLTDPRMVQIDTLNQLYFFSNNSRVYQLIQTLPAYPQPSVDYNFNLGFIRYPSWSYACRTSSTYDLYKTTDKILFKAPKEALLLTLSITVACTLFLTILMRLFFIIRHVVDLKSRSSYNALMLTDEEIAEQMPNLDILKSFKKQCCLFVFQLLLTFGMAGSVIYSIIILTRESVWIKEITKISCTDQYLLNIFFYYESNIDKMSSFLIEASFLWGVLLISEFCYFVTRNKIGDLFAKTIEVQSEKQPSVNQEQLDAIDKEQKIEGYANVNESSEIIIQKDQNSEIKIYDMEYLMGDAGNGQTKSNFFGSLDREASISVSKKKKKKKFGNKKKKIVVADDQL